MKDDGFLGPGGLIGIFRWWPDPNGPVASRYWLQSKLALAAKSLFISVNIWWAADQWAPICKVGKRQACTTDRQTLRLKALIESQGLVRALIKTFALNASGQIQGAPKFSECLRACYSVRSGSKAKAEPSEAKKRKKSLAELSCYVQNLI